ncbi:SDR family oxidoreductase [Aureimonas fodinaquatilis]|uniref:SDR family oxidoreductase n=1 Tax=Aureimonas fodinaquatilis TaxID=2565783 RepID=A0A5B0DXY2_9HYPH|nr:SDR family oxidoreductase [Aureimonas fodinaquatilis]KAA0970420.1 SDR family oxidoreductase [Aureimonas fodinaquatilis]
MSVVDTFRLDGKRALVTGCSRGIGAAMATALADAGADIIGVSASLKSDSPIERAVRSVGRQFTGYAVDFSRREAVVAFAEAMEREQIDILVNNGGTIRRAPAARHSLEDWDAILEVNLNAQFVLTQAIGRGMLERRSGKVIFTASLLSFQGGINVPAYAASKGAIAQLTKSLANEWAERGVNVNAIAPGYIATDNTAALQADAARSALIVGRIPAGRWGKPEDFAGPVVFLASSASDYVSGSVMLVDGGWMGR